MAALRVLVVEDTVDISELISRALASEGCEVHCVGDLRAARARLAGHLPDVIVLDVELPDGSGLDLLRDRRSTGDVPIVILSARESEMDRVLGLELGAEDYVVKPFHPRELATRVRKAASRRPPDEKPARSGILDLGDLQVDLDRREVVVRGEVVSTTAQEFDLLAHLARAPGRVFTREDLLRDVWNSKPEWQTSKTVTEHIRRLRNKIELNAASPRRLVTVSRSGYRLEP